MFKIFKKKLSGFTLMEMLISMSIFIIITLAVLSIHTSILHSSQKTLAANRTQQEAQLIMESLAKKIRTSRVNYDYSGYDQGIDDIEYELALIDLTDTEYVFFMEDDAVKIKSKASGQSSYSTPQAIPASHVLVNNLQFIIMPPTSPFDINTPPETQPRVTIIMDFHSTKGEQIAHLTIQQTVPQLSGGIID